MSVKNVVAIGILWGGLAGSAQAKVRNLEVEHVPHQLIINLSEKAEIEDINSLLERNGMKLLHSFRNGAVLVETRSIAGLESIGAMIAAHPSVRSVETNQIIRINAVPNDEKFGELYGMHNEGQTGGTADVDIDAPEAWEISTGSRDVVVGIIDTGVDYTHPDLAANYWSNPGEVGLDANGNDKATNGIDDDGNGYIDDWRGWDFVNNDNDPMDDHSHGTHCAGTIGAIGNNGEGVAGVNWEVSIVGLKFLSAGGSGSLANAVKAIEYATDLGVTLTSNSWGGGGFSDLMQAAIAEAEAKGILFVAAAGNSGTNNDRSPHYPSSYENDNVVAVAATDHKGDLARFSCFGATSVDVAAPGVDILSTVLHGKFKKFSGTSMATPHVAGVAALIKAVYPDAKATEIKARLLNTADFRPSLDGKILTGSHVNAFSSLENDTIPPSAPGSLEVVDVTTTELNVRWRASGDDGEDGDATRYLVRYSSEPIDGEAAWEAATDANVTINGTLDDGFVSATINDLEFNSSGYLAVRALDNVGNVGDLSETVPFQVKSVKVVAEHRAESMDGVVADAPWGLQKNSARGGTTFSDSPKGSYANNADISLTMSEIAVASTDLTLVFHTTHDLETRYDFGYVEISIDGGSNWTKVDRLTGAADWSRKVYALRDYLNGATAFQIRFRLTSDYSVTKDGWQIDDILVLGPAS